MTKRGLAKLGLGRIAVFRTAVWCDITIGTGIGTNAAGRQPTRSLSLHKRGKRSLCPFALGLGLDYLVNGLFGHRPINSSPLKFRTETVATVAAVHETITNKETCVLFVVDQTQPREEL